MTDKQRKTLLISAIIAGVISLPMTWLTVKNVSMLPGGFAQMLPGFASMSINITGFSGFVNLLIKSPLWFIVLIAIAANVLQLMRNSKSVEIPKLAEWITAIVAVVWTTFPILIAVINGQVTPAVGWLLGVFCAATPLACLWLERNVPAPVVEMSRSSSDSATL